MHAFNQGFLVIDAAPTVERVRRDVDDTHHPGAVNGDQTTFYIQAIYLEWLHHDCIHNLTCKDTNYLQK